MASISTFYLSRVFGGKIYSTDKKAIGKLKDLIVDLNYIRPKVIAARVRLGFSTILIDFSNITVTKKNGQYEVVCKHIEEIKITPENTLFLVKNVLDKQIVDIDGRKLERVNDVRLATLPSGTFLVAVDVGIEGLLRRLAIAKPLKMLIKPFGKNLPSNLILWEDVATISYGHGDIKLAKSQSKLSTLHPSDLADIIEDLDRKTQVELFKSLDEERAADVLEELELDAQINLLENLSVEKAADVLEKMPADEAADILDDLDDEKAEEILLEMEAEASEEVRELMEYPENQVGSLMATDYISFTEDMSVNDTIIELRKIKPESNTIYYLYVLDKLERLVATVSLRDLVVSNPEIKLREIMNKNVINVFDYDKLDELAEIISKYNLLAIPVVSKEMKMLGIVIIDDVVFTLLKSRKRRL